MSDASPEGRELTAAEKATRERRNRSIAMAIIAFVIIVFAVTLLRLGASVAQ